MTKIFCVIGELQPFRGTWWPVTFCVCEADVKTTLDVLYTEMQRLLAALKPIGDQLDALEKTSRAEFRFAVSRASRIKATAQYEARQRTALEEVHAKQNRIIELHTKTALDPLFPAEHASAVRYRMVVFSDDPRDIEQATILQMRAELFGSTAARRELSMVAPDEAEDSSSDDDNRYDEPDDNLP